MRRTAAALLAFCTLTLSEVAAPQANPEVAGFSAEGLNHLGDVVERAIDAGQLAGAVVLVQRHGQPALFDAYGKASVDTNRRMQTSDVFRIASMTKPITSAAVMMLYEEGVIGLDDPVGKYLPSFDKTFEVIRTNAGGFEFVPAGGPITIRQLLTHTSGISYGFMNTEPLTTMYREAGISDGLQGDTVPLSEFVRRLSKMPLLHEPGEAFSYSLGADVLGRLVEVVSGRPFDVFLQERLFEPLGMKETWFEVPDGIEARMPAVHRAGPDGNLEVLPPGPIEDGVTRFSVDFPYDDVTVFPSGGAGLSSTITDYARFLQMILNGGTLDGTRVLDEKTVELMTTDQLAHLESLQFGSEGFTLGFGLTSRPGAGDGEPASRLGWGGFFNTQMWIDPGEELLAILMTQHYPYGIEVMERFPELVYEAIED